jgi:hypothetical protein
MTAPEAPENHPQPNRWWDAIRRQSWLCYLALIAEAGALFFGDISQSETTPQVIINLGLLAGAAAYGGGSTLVDTVRAWKGAK